MKEQLVSKIELLLRSRLVKEALSSVLIEAGLSVLGEPSQPNTDVIAVIDFEDCKDRVRLQAHQARGVAIVALSSQADGRELDPEETAMLSGVLTHKLSVAAFVDSLRLIGLGERVFPRDLATGRRSEAAPSGAELGPDSGLRLSPREKDILSHLFAGRLNKLIARVLGITEGTVKVHLKSLFRKIGVENRTQAVIWALANLPELKGIPRGFV
jgi:two-component system nitrate/nitrite response regulator NarL